MTAPTPEAPQGVRIIRTDGTVTPVEVEFIGTEPEQIDGEVYIINRWKVATDTFMGPGDQLDADVVPAYSSIVLMRVGVR